jgi:copper homeostasis protein (lipoprotein)
MGMRLRYWGYLVLLLTTGLFACKHKPEKAAQATATYKGMYSFGPEEKSFKDCNEGREFWVADSSAQLELQYSQLHFEKPYEPVYIEVVGEKVLSPKDDISSVFDSTLVVRNVIKISRDIPANCN